MKPLEIGPISIRRTAAGAVSLLVERDGDVAFINLSDREATALAIGLFSVVPEQISRVAFEAVFGALLDDAIGAAAAMNRAERLAGGIGEA